MSISNVLVMSPGNKYSFHLVQNKSPNANGQLMSESGTIPIKHVQCISLIMAVSIHENSWVFLMIAAY